MNELPQAQFNGWARVEVMGHQQHIGYVQRVAELKLTALPAPSSEDNEEDDSDPYESDNEVQF